MFIIIAFFVFISGLFCALFGLLSCMHLKSIAYRVLMMIFGLLPLLYASLIAAALFLGGLVKLGALPESVMNYLGKATLLLALACMPLLWYAPQMLRALYDKVRGGHQSEQA